MGDKKKPVDDKSRHINCFERIGLFFMVHWKGVVIVLVPLICLFIILPPPVEPYQWVAYTLVIMAIYWMTECIPLAVTGLIPIVIFPFTDVMDTFTTIQCYFNDTILMFLGSLLLASAVEQSGLHIRLALFCIRIIGYSHRKLLFAISLVTMFVSMWITNTAATTMMVPIIFAILGVFEKQKLLTIYEKNDAGDKVASKYTVCYFCAATYAATIGGIGTLVGTGTNLTMRGLFYAAFPAAPDLITFPKFSFCTIPLMLISQFLCWVIMSTQYLGMLRPKSKAAKAAKIPPEALKAAKDAVTEDSKKLGRITYWEWTVLILFSACIVSFFCRSPKMFEGWGDAIEKFYGGSVKILDSVCAMFWVFMMVLLPSHLSILKNFTAKYREQLPKKSQSSSLDFNVMDPKAPYSFCFLLGGGFALSTAAGPSYTNLNAKIGAAMASLQKLPNVWIVLIVILITVFITNFASNVAVCNIITPIAMHLALVIKQNPLQYNIATGIAASFCFCLPVGTPGNLVVQSAARVTTPQMMVAGILPSIMIIIVTWLVMVIWAPVVWPEIHDQTPVWAVST